LPQNLLADIYNQVYFLAYQYMKYFRISVMSEIYKYDYKPDAMKALAANTHLMDPVRNQFLKDYYPLCYEMLEEIK